MTEQLHARGVELARAGKLDEARAIFEQVLALDPERTSTLNNLGNVLRELGQRPAAIALLDRAYALGSRTAALFVNRARCLLELDRAADALAVLDEAAALHPGHANLAAVRSVAVQAQHRLGVRLLERGEQRAAIRALERAERAAATEEERATIGSSRLFAMCHDEHCSRRALFEAHAAWGAALERRRGTVARSSVPTAIPHVVYLSPDLKSHVVTLFLEPVLRAHDPARVRITLASATQQPDAITQVLRARHAFVDLRDASREAAREALAALAPDVIVELAGHSADLLDWLVPRIAPLQLSWLGYPGSTGLRSIDGRITDALIDPEGSEQDYTEQLVRLPRLPWALVRDHAPDVNERDQGPIVFGCLNRVSKLSDSTLESWTRILSELPDARLILRSPLFEEEAERRRMLEAFRACAARVELRPAVPRDGEPLYAYRDIDIALDTFPYQGTTTTYDALTMGVPVVSRIGDTPPARVARSLLEAVGLGDLAVASCAEYVAVAASLARDRPRLSSLRRSLRDRVKAGPLGDARGLAHALEQVYRAGL